MGNPIGDENGGSCMLVFSRKNQESLVIGGSDGFQRVVKVTVLEIRGENVKLGFEADGDVSVQRLEVWKRIRASRQADNPTGPPAEPVAW
jgi:carbon storage regulator CsrA